MRRRNSPWAQIADRANIIIRHRDLTHTEHQGVTVPIDDGWAIILCTTLTQTERSAVLAHELAHIDRGGGAWAQGMPTDWAAIVARDERACDRAAVFDLIPRHLLADWLQRQDGGVTPADVAQEWDIPVWLAQVALDELAA